MDIRYLGHSSFRINNREAALVTDPYKDSATGLKFPKVEADIITISHNHQDHNFSQAIDGNPVVIQGPGEYEIKNVRIQGITTYHDNDSGKKRGKNTIYHIVIDDVHLLHCGDLGHILEDQQIEAIPDIDIVFIPVGGYFTIDAEEATKIITKLEPRIVIPMHYKRPGLSEDLAAHLAPVDTFLKSVGKDTITPLPKLTISKDKLPPELQIVVLE